MTGNDATGVALRQRAYLFVLSGSYWFGLVALLLHAADHTLFGMGALKEDVPRQVKWWVEDSRTSGMGYMLRNGAMYCEVPAQLLVSAVSLGVLGAALALVAFALRWRRPLPSAVALVLNVVPALVSFGLILRGRL
jgi:hypothetical protein